MVSDGALELAQWIAIWLLVLVALSYLVVPRGRS